MRRDAFDRYASAVLIVGGALLVKLIVAPLLDAAPFLPSSAGAASLWRSGLGAGPARRRRRHRGVPASSASPAPPSPMPARLAAFAVESAAVAVFVAPGIELEPPEPRTGKWQAAVASLVATELQVVLDWRWTRASRYVRRRRIILEPAGGTIFGWSGAEALARRRRADPPTTDRDLPGPALRFPQTATDPRPPLGPCRDRRLPARGRITARRERQSWAFTASAADITERKQAERRRGRAGPTEPAGWREQGAREEAETANRMKDEFPGHASHQQHAAERHRGWLHIPPGGLTQRIRPGPSRIDRNAKVQGQPSGHPRRLAHHHRCG
jgi:PAS domain-containing protein